MSVLVLGFGAFGQILDNPSSRLSRAVDGRIVGLKQVKVVGAEMPVSYARGWVTALEYIRRTEPIFTLGIGVAATRVQGMIESRARNVASVALFDIDDRALGDLGTGPLEIQSPDAEALASALGIALSHDAGEYVCNAWLFQMLRARQRVGFLHVPVDGFPADQLAEGLGRFVDGL
ncbi:MAG: hypothetical protein EXR71_02945 [Myxococcales bacterium]|nr:hypothetical protein [Myxococcales bacterium]